jgi:hypothetical protein
MPLKEAAQDVGYSVNYFRRTFCNKEKPLITIRVQRGRILVLRVEIEALIENETRRPA